MDDAGELGRQGVATARTFIVKFINDWSINLASMIAYSLITAIFPLLLLILSLAFMALQALGPSYFNQVVAAINQAFPAQNAVDATTLRNSLIQINGPLAIASLIGLLWLGSNLFASIESAFCIIFRIRGRDPVRQRIMAFGMVLILTVLLPVSLAAASLVTAGSDEFRTLLPRSLGRVLTFVGPITSLIVLWLLFLAIYVVVPNVRVRPRYVWRGALVAAILFALLQLVFPLYGKVFLSGNTRYGAAVAAVLVVIIWLWFFALITVIGAQINAVAMGLTPLPFDLARTVETVAQQSVTEAGAVRLGPVPAEAVQRVAEKEAREKPQPARGRRGGRSAGR